MTRSSPQELAAKYGADVTTQAFEEAKRKRAKDHLAFAQGWLEEHYGQGDPGKKRKVRCDGCSRPSWIDDMMVRGNEALCEDCTEPLSPGMVRIFEVIARGVEEGFVRVHVLDGGVAELTPTARKVAAYWERS